VHPRNCPACRVSGEQAFKGYVPLRSGGNGASVPGHVGKGALPEGSAQSGKRGPRPEKKLLQQGCTTVCQGIEGEEGGAKGVEERRRS